MDIVCLGELLVEMFPSEVGQRLVDVSAFKPNPEARPRTSQLARLGSAPRALSSARWVTIYSARKWPIPWPAKGCYALQPGDRLDRQV